LREFDLLAVVSLPAGVFKPYAGVKTSVLVSATGGRSPSRGSRPRRRVWFYEIRNDGFDPDKIQGGGRPETPEKNDIPGLLSAWVAYRATRFEKPPGVEAGSVLPLRTEQSRCWWAPFETVVENDFNLAASRYKPRGRRSVDDDPPNSLARCSVSKRRSR